VSLPGVRLGTEAILQTNASLHASALLQPCHQPATIDQEMFLPQTLLNLHQLVVPNRPKSPSPSSASPLCAPRSAPPAEAFLPPKDAHHAASATRCHPTRDSASPALSLPAHWRCEALWMPALDWNAVTPHTWCPSSKTRVWFYRWGLALRCEMPELETQLCQRDPEAISLFIYSLFNPPGFFLCFGLRMSSEERDISSTKFFL